MENEAGTVEERAETAVVGAGPIGLELGVALKQTGISTLHFDKGQIGQTITTFPKLMHFFSSPQRIAIAGVPIQTIDQSRCTREEYLAYLRGVVTQFDLDVRTFEAVVKVVTCETGGFAILTRSAAGERSYRSETVVLATGGTAHPRKIGIPGEDLPHVSHRFDEPHKFFRKKLVIIGGRNSAVETALRCRHAGADVTISYRGGAFDPDSIKYWLLPEIQGCIRDGEIRAFMQTRPVAIEARTVTLERDDGSRFSVDADFVLLLTGFIADMGLFEQAGVELTGEERAPVFDESTMETNVPGLYVAGTATGGSQGNYRTFLETCHIHVDRIVAALTGAPAPAAVDVEDDPER